MIKPLSNCIAILFCVFVFSCSSHRVVMHESRQSPQKAPPATATSAKEKTSAQPATKSPETLAVQPKEILSKEQLAELDTFNNLTALKKNISNAKISTDLIENKLTLQELEAAAADPSYASVKPQLLLKAGKLYQKDGQPEKASEYFRSVTTLYPQTAFANQGNILLLTSQAAQGVDVKVIGAVLPITGKNSSIGQHALNALRMGLDLDKPDAKFRLALFDSQGDADLAAKGVDKLVKEDRVVAILGGFTSKEATAIATRSELYSVPCIGFSQKSGLTNIGENVFRNSITPEMQVDRLVQFAVEKLSAKKFAVLFPNDTYGVEFSNIFWDHVLARGGEVTAAQTYDPKETDFSEPIQKLLGTFYTEARAGEYKQRLKEIRSSRKDSKQKSSRDHWGEENVLPPIVDFDVIFVPDNSRALGQILAFMKYNEVSDINYLGTNIWNSPDLPKRAANEDAGLYFVDAIDISSNGSQKSSFLKDYAALYREEPTLVEIQVYEAAKIVKDQLIAGVSSRSALASNLRSLGRTGGVTGELRMSNQREIERPLHILTLDSGLVKKIE